MDETAYKSARGEINRLPCVFEKALLSRCVVCELSVRHLLAERETVACTDPPAHAACGELSGLLREKSSFALKLTEAVRILPHAMIMKIQCGGLGGLRDVLDPEAPAPDVHRLVRRAQAEYGALEALPFSRIVQGVSHWQGRKRNAPRDPD
ncbi:hypothetical protein [Sulfurisoma sediminicola]|uniref:Uncharacterized protein n=1 Tax=Sulfurisoma sediminicola TaxID=1381557 RepID=A0A497XJU6_9PROT|nr:hypothetical protein [Sulfurisoma sediminicola]RLJ67630.1 hypothetical protein DFR35_0179 [Sulfurisoma sediminicola]